MGLVKEMAVVNTPLPLASLTQTGKAIYPQSPVLGLIGHIYSSGLQGLDIEHVLGAGGCIQRVAG